MSAASVVFALALITAQDLLDIVDIGIGWGAGVISDHDFDGLAVSPDRQWIAIDTRRANLARNDTDIRWIILPLQRPGASVDAGDGGEPISLVYYGLTNGYSRGQVPLWSPDSQWIVYRLKRAGQIQLWRSGRDGSRQEQLTHNAADIESFRWSSDGRKLLFRVGESRESIAAASKSEAARGFLYDERFAPGFATTPLRDPEASEKHVWVYDLVSRAEQSATTAEETEFEQLQKGIVLDGRPTAKWVRRSRDGRSLVWLEDLRADRSLGVGLPVTIVASRARDASGARACTARQCTGQFKGLWISEDGATVYFLRWISEHQYGSMALYSWATGVGDVNEILRIDGLIEGCAQVGQRLVCTHESATTPKKLVTIDLKTRQQETIFDPNPHFKDLQFGQVTALTWSAPRGIEGFGHLVLPVGYEQGNRYPLIVVQYRSRGFLRGGIGDEYPIHLFAANGFAVLSFDRPEDEELEASSKTYDEVEQKGWVDYRDRRRVLSSLEAGIDQLNNLGIIDPKRVGITGLSDGGETVGFALVRSPDRFAAAAASWTCWNPIMFYLVGPKFQRWLERYGFGDPDGETRPLWQGISVALNAERIRTPLLVQVSDFELMPEAQMFAALRKYRKPVEMYVFPNEYHIKAQPVHRLNIYRRNLQWFQFWLQSSEAPDPVDPDQYTRWRALRELRDRQETSSAL